MVIKSVLKNRSFYHRLQMGVAILLLVFLEQVGLTKPFRAFGEAGIEPLQTVAVGVVRIGTVPFELINQRYAEVQRLEDLERRHSEALAEISQLEQLQKENAELRRLLEQPLQSSQQRVLAAPVVSLSRPIVAAGSMSAVQPKSLVMASGALLGLVEDVSERQASVLLLQRMQESVLLANTESGVQGVIRGDGRRILLDELPRDAEIEPGERITTTGQEGIPSGLLIGTAGVIENEQTASVQSVLVVQPVSFYEVPLVEIVW